MNEQGAPAAPPSTPGRVARVADGDRTVVLLALAVVVLTTAVAVLANGWTRELNSDDFGWQRLLDIWTGQGHSRAWISEDLFYVRYPLFLTLDAVGITGRAGVMTASVLLNVLAAVAFAAGMVLSGEVALPLRRHAIATLAVVSVWAPVAWNEVFFSPNTRSLEFGLAIVVLAVLGHQARGTWPRRAVIALTVVLASLLWLSDPFVLYAIGGPAVVVAALDLLGSARRRQALYVLGVIASSAVLTIVLRRVIELVDVIARPVAGGAFFMTDPGDVPARFERVMSRLFALLGISGSDLTAASLDTVVAWLRLGLVALALVGAVAVLRTWARSTLLARTLVVTLAATPLLVTMFNVWEDPAIVIDRYLGGALIAVAGLAIVAVHRLTGHSPDGDGESPPERPRAGSDARSTGFIARAVTPLVALLVAAVLVANAVHWWDERDAAPEAGVTRLGALVPLQGWDWVYGHYWLAVRQHQMAPGGSRWIHVECDAGGPLRLMPWHNDRAVLRGDPETIAVALEAMPCTLDDLIAVYGPTDRVVTLDGHRFAVWNTADASPRLRTLS